MGGGGVLHCGGSAADSATHAAKAQGRSTGPPVSKPNHRQQFHFVLLIAVAKQLPRKKDYGLLLEKRLKTVALLALPWTLCETVGQTAQVCVSLLPMGRALHFFCTIRLYVGAPVRVMAVGLQPTFLPASTALLSVPHICITHTWKLGGARPRNRRVRFCV